MTPGNAPRCTRGCCHAVTREGIPIEAEKQSVPRLIRHLVMCNDPGIDARPKKLPVYVVPLEFLGRSTSSAADEDEPHPADTTALPCEEYALQLGKHTDLVRV